MLSPGSAAAWCMTCVSPVLASPRVDCFTCTCLAHLGFNTTDLLFSLSFQQGKAELPRVLYTIVHISLPSDKPPNFDPSSPQRTFFVTDPYAPLRPQRRRPCTCSPRNPLRCLCVCPCVLVPRPQPRLILPVRVRVPSVPLSGTTPTGLEPLISMPCPVPSRTVMPCPHVHSQQEGNALCSTQADSPAGSGHPCCASRSRHTVGSGAVTSTAAPRLPVPPARCTTNCRQCRNSGVVESLPLPLLLLLPGACRSAASAACCGPERSTA